MSKCTIIVAGGSGKRMRLLHESASASARGSVPKQFMLLKGRPVLCWTIEAFHGADPAMPIIVVLPKDQEGIWRTLCIGHHFHVEHTVVHGGEERYHSVRNGLAAAGDADLVAVHDGVRPLIDAGLIARCFEAAREHGAAIPVVPITSSVRSVDGEMNRAMDRSTLRAVQTPQCFRTELLRRAFELPYDPAFTDEATLVERMGTHIHLVEGEERNLKITTPVDLQVAELLMG
ncbi:MAG TPA: 2-C-methyl-D-erythritol 4-phosphate cytidylyltransferase [Flavobacteriales bacterium]